MDSGPCHVIRDLESLPSSGDVACCMVVRRCKASQRGGSERGLVWCGVAVAWCGGTGSMWYSVQGGGAVGGEVIWVAKHREVGREVGRNKALGICAADSKCDHVISGKKKTHVHESNPRLISFDKKGKYNFSNAPNHPQPFLLVYTI